MSKKVIGDGDGQSPIPVIAYLRVSTDEQGRSGLGLAAQRESIERAADYKGWEVIEWIEDTASGKSLERPGIERARSLLEDDGPRLLVAAKLDRIARSAVDFLNLTKEAETNGWAIAVLDIGQGDELDTTTSMGKFTATVLSAVAELERDMISERTRAALAEAKRKGTKLGRPPAKHPPALVNRIRRDRDRGASFATIADELNRDGVETLKGTGRWHPSSVKRVLDRAGE